MHIQHRSFAFRALFVGALSVLVVLPSWAQQGANQDDQRTREELRAVLIQARDALVRVATEDHSTLNTSISDRVSNLVQSLLYIGDLDSVRYLQQHLKEVYRDQIRFPLKTSPMIQDFKGMVREAEHEKDSGLRDEKLVRVVQQQIKQGFLEDAATIAGKVRQPDYRVQLFLTIAAAQHGKGDNSAAERALDAAIHACLEPPRNIYVGSADRQLEALAKSLAEDNYVTGARSALSRARQLLMSQGGSNGILWFDFALTAIDIGDLQSASDALHNIEDGTNHSDLEERIIVAQSRKADPDNALRMAVRIESPDRRANVLCDIARKQAVSGSKRTAAATIELALEAAALVNQFRVFVLNDIAWTQIDIGDLNGAEKTVDLALRENEKPSWGTDKVNGWVVLADTMAVLGHFDRAHDIAAKINDHYFRGCALANIAQREVETGQSDEALAWAKQLKDPDERAAVYLSIAQSTIQNLKDESK